LKRNMRHLKRGVNPVIATILIISIAVAATAAVYIWHTSFQSRLQEETESTYQEHSEHKAISIKIEKIGFYTRQSDGALQLWIWVRNTGTQKVTLDTIYLTNPDGSVGYRQGIPAYLATLNPGELSTNLIITFAKYGNPPPPPPGTPVTVKVATKEGAEAVASVIVPEHG